MKIALQISAMILLIVALLIRDSPDAKKRDVNARHSWGLFLFLIHYLQSIPLSNLQLIYIG